MARLLSLFKPLTQHLQSRRYEAISYVKPNPQLNFLPLSFWCRQFSRRISGNGQSLKDNMISDFVRFRRGSGPDGDDSGVSELQTAVVSYRKVFPCSTLHPSLRVDLVSTIHVGDKEYYETLQKELENYDCVLFEMIAKREFLENTNPDANRRLKNFVKVANLIERSCFRILRLEFQDCLNYKAKNWYHADLDYETYQRRELAENSESLPESQTNVFIQGVVGLVGSECPQVKEALSRLDFVAATKLFLAKELMSLSTRETREADAKSLDIGERNRVAAEALKKAIGEGHNKIAILYGAGHMPDLGRRLREGFDLVPTRARWMTAWSIKERELFPFLKKWPKFLVGLNKSLHEIFGSRSPSLVNH